MIKTCGKTKPLLILNNLTGIPYDSLIYSHYEFMRPESQPEPYSDINSEINYLQKITGSDTTQFNKLGKWYCYNYYDKSEDIDSDFFTNNFYEFISKQFEWKSQEGLLSIVLSTFPNAIISDKCFEPCGYSLNLLQGITYLTVHVTPQNSCSYISIESNFTGSMELFKKIAQELKSITYEIHSSVESVLNYIDSSF
jgi:S-adenosylmethionine decarboxylase